MRRILALILGIVLLCCLTGCTDDQTQRAAELYTKYADLIDALEEGNYHFAIGHVASMAQQAQGGQQERPTPVSVLSGSWYLRESDSNHVSAPRQLSFSADGTASIDGSSVIWVEQDSHERGLSGILVQDGENRFYFSFSIGKGSIASLNLFTCQVNGNLIHAGNQIASYYNHPLAFTLLRNWQSMDIDEGMPEYLHLQPEGASVEGAEFSYTITSEKGEAFISASMLASNGSEIAYELLMQEQDGHYIVTLTGSQGTGVYFNSDLGFEESWQEYRYPILMDHLENYLDHGYFWGNNVYYERNEALKYLYEQLTDMGSYKNCAELLTRFTLLPDMLVQVNHATVDQLGNESTTAIARYTYNSDGTPAVVMGDEFMERFGIYNASSSNKFYITYQEDGTIADVKLGWSQDDIKAIGTPSYDPQGNMTAMDVQSSVGAYTSRFTYDESGRLHRVDIQEFMYYYDYHYSYTYDEAGNLIQKIVTYDNDYYKETTDYTYENGILIRAYTLYESLHADPYTTDYTFTNDTHGRPISATITTTNPGNTYKSVMDHYIYDTVFFLDTEDLVKAES